MKFCIATPKRPINFEAFLAVVKESADEGALTVHGYVVVEGNGCWNHGIMLTGIEDEAEKFMNQLTMALMPARWSRVSDNDPAVVPGSFHMVSKEKPNEL